MIVVGDTGAGKTNIIQTFDKGVAPNYTTPTVGVDYFSKTMSVDSTHNKVKMQIWDTAGQEQYRSIIKGYPSAYSGTTRTQPAHSLCSMSPAATPSTPCGAGSTRSGNVRTSM